MHQLIANPSPAIFRAYDIRGIVGETLNADMVYTVAKAIGSLAQEQGESTIIVARDGRLSGPALSKALCQGLNDSGCDVIDIGAVPTPLLYFATHVLGARSGVMLTGSHNPGNYNGLKIAIQGETLSEEKIQAIYQRIQEKKFLSGKGTIKTSPIISQYIQRIKKDVQLKKHLKIVIDCGHGITGHVAPELFKQLGCDVIELFCKVDGNFPAHHPDPSVAENLQDLISSVQKYQADIGLAFDGDGDRLGVVTNTGKIIWPDRQMMLFAKNILAKQKSAEIIFDVKCSRHLADLITQLGGKATLWKTGHSLIKRKLLATGAALAGEMSGHLFFNDRWYGFDDALYAAARLLEILSLDARSSEEIFAALPDSVNTPELKIVLSEEGKFSFMEKFSSQAIFPEGELITIDGVRVDFPYGFGLIRASNTTPCLVLRFEADSEKNLTHIQNLFREKLLAVDKNLVLPF